MGDSGSRLLVVGAGYVGLVTAVGFATAGHDVTVVEKRADRLEALLAGRVPIFEAGLQDAYDAAVAADRLRVADTPGGDPEIVMVCVGTPIGMDGQSDLSQVRGALNELRGQLGPEVPLVIRSTMPPGSTRLAVTWAGVPESHVFANPEFLRQGTALEDFQKPSRIVIGRFPGADPDALSRVVALYRTFNSPLHVMDTASAELVKNGSNAFLALKLSFTNEIAAMAEEFGANADDVLAGIAGDPRIGGAYMRPGLGFGGSCLPKELRAMALAGAGRGLPMLVTTAASEANHAQMLRFTNRVEAAIGGLEGRTVAVLGLAFKAGTDDTRDSPPVRVIRLLLERGARVVGMDPQAGAGALRDVPAMRLADDPMDAVTGADCCIIGTEWPEFRSLDWGAIRDRMRSPLVVDGRRLLDERVMLDLGFRYLAVGSPERTADGSRQPPPMASRA